MRTTLESITAVLASVALATANPVPAELPDPDGKPGGASKPVKVYILAGQSNMVGMGNLSGATNVYDGVYFSSDPAVPEAPLPIYKAGNFYTAPLAVFTADGQPPTGPLVEGLLAVPQSGTYRFHANATLKVDGKDAKTDPVTLTAGQRYPFEFTGFRGNPPHFWCEKTDLQGNGDLESVAKRDGMFPWLVDDAGEYTVRHDVYFQEARLNKDGKGSPLSPTSNGGKTIGPELGFGHVVGHFHDEQVLLIKTAQGNRSLGFDFRPPSSGRTDPDNEFESAEYRLMVEGVRKTLDNIQNVVPGYDGQGYELAGFAWFQGHKDSFSEEGLNGYEKHLANLIHDVRKEFDVPKLPAVVATVGFGGNNMQEKFVRILDAQLAVSSKKRYPDFAGNVASVDTRPFWRGVPDSPKGEDYHYNRNAETYMRIGDAIGRAMVGLLGGKADPLPAPPPPPRKAEGTGSEPSEAQLAAGQKALRPIVVDGIAAAYIADPRYNKSLVDEAAGTPPQRPNQFLRGAMYGLRNIYRAAGVTDYDWKVFGDDLRDQQWDYLSFDPAEAPAKQNGPRYRTVTYPAGSENWSATSFDTAKAGWKKGLPPFGQLGGKLEPLRTCDRTSGCGCGEKPRTLWDKEVILVRGTFDVPPVKDGHRYRIVVGGSNHVTTGEGYAVYLDGKQLAESKTGVPNRQGGQPRGAHVYTTALDDLRDGKATIAVTNFLQTHKRGNPIPHAGHLTVWIEEQKIPPVMANAPTTDQ